MKVFFEDINQDLKNLDIDKMSKMRQELVKSYFAIFEACSLSGSREINMKLMDAMDIVKDIIDAVDASY